MSNGLPGERGVRRTFEEQTAAELDGLYQGALFLTAGDARRAEVVLVEAVTSSFRDPAHPAEPEAFRRQLEARLANVFLRRSRNRRPRRLDHPRLARARTPTLGGLEPEELHRAAASVPPPGRVALWLVLFRRWSYADAAECMGVDRAQLVDLLRYRDTFVASLFAGTNRVAGDPR